MVFSAGYDPEDIIGGHFRSSGRKYRPKSSRTDKQDKRHDFGDFYRGKDPKGLFAEDIWDFDDSWFASGRRQRCRLDVFGDLLWELVRLQSLLDYLLSPRSTYRSTMSPGDDYRRSRKRDGAYGSTSTRKPRARSTHGPPRATFDEDDDLATGTSPTTLFDSDKYHRRRDASSSARIPTRDAEDVTRSSVPISGNSEHGKEEKGWRTLTKELRKLLSSKFSDKEDAQDDDSSTATDTSPRSTRRHETAGPSSKPSETYTTGISVTKFGPSSGRQKVEPRVVREIPIRRLNTAENHLDDSRHRTTHGAVGSGPKSHSFNERSRDWKAENRTSYPKFSKPPQPQRATMHFATPQPDTDFLFAFTATPPPSSSSRARSPRPSSFTHGSSSSASSGNTYGARVIFHPIFQTGRNFSTSFNSAGASSSRNARAQEDDDGLPPVIITEITEEEADEIARKQQREREDRDAGRHSKHSHHRSSSARPPETRHHNKKSEESPSRLRCELCYGSLRIGSGDDMSLSCDHLFHSKCILEWLGRKSTCPVCHVLIIRD